MDEKQFNIVDELNALAAEAHTEEASADNAKAPNDTPDLSMDDQLNTLRATNWDLLNYFRSVYVTQSEQIQTLKTELFELNVKIEELEKTKNIYSFQSDTRRNFFSPLPVNSDNQGKGQVIQAQLDELQEVRTSLSKRIQKLEQDLTTIRTHIQSLEAANQSLASLYQSLPQSEAPSEEAVPDSDIPATDSTEDSTYHACQILMFNQYDKSQAAKQLRSSLQQGLENNQNRLEVLKWLIQSDPTRARLTLQELQDTNTRLLHTTDMILQDLDQSLTTQPPIWLAIDDCIQHYKSLHPECSIDASVDCTDYELHVLPIITITLLQLLREIMDNIFYYSNANRILVKVYINTRMVDVYINDNGAGIPSDYLTASPWHSGLHRLHEIVHLLDGKLQIDGDIISGTNIRFSFPICTEPETSAPGHTSATQQ